MNVILFDNNREITIHYYTRPISFFRVGILTIKQKWEKYYGSVSIKTQSYLKQRISIKYYK